MTAEQLAAGLAPTPGYRYADREGDQLFVAGQVPLDGAGDLRFRDDAAGQATACLENLQTLIGVHGFSVDDIRRVVIHVVGEHRNLLDAWGAVTAWFPGDVPPATLLGSPGLGYEGQLVEIDATIVRRGGPASAST